MPTGGVTAVGRLLDWAAAARGRNFGLSFLCLAAELLRRVDEARYLRKRARRDGPMIAGVEQ